jgi:RNA polymerase sigma-70 factor (ECF subfamily)
MADFDEVYRTHVNAVFRYAVRVLGRRDVAEEVTNDAFLALFRSFDSIDTSQLPKWLFTVVRNRATDFWRRATLERRYFVDMENDPPAEQAKSVLEWLDATPALKPVHRACLLLRYVHGLERAEIASRLGLSENQVKGYLQYARQLLRKELIDRE